jgi:predicted Rossmann fold nucleotide-binding protein DprA/Smf involved in DNA uptake
MAYGTSGEPTLPSAARTRARIRDAYRKEEQQQDEAVKEALANAGHGATPEQLAGRTGLPVTLVQTVLRRLQARGEVSSRDSAELAAAHKRRRGA